MATPKGIANLVAFLVKVYGSRAQVQLGDDLAKDLLFEDLRDFSDEEVAHGANLMRREQESVFADGHSIYALVLKWTKKARRDLRRQGRRAERESANTLRAEELRKIAAEMTPEKMAVNRYRISLIRDRRFREATRISSLSVDEAVAELPEGALKAAERIWRLARGGDCDAILGRDDALPAALPETTEGGD